MKHKAHYLVLGLFSSLGKAGYMEDKLKELRGQGIQAHQVLRTAPAREESMDYKPILDASIPKSVYQNYDTPVTPPPTKIPTDSKGNHKMTARFHAVLDPQDEYSDEAHIANAAEATKSRMQGFVEKMAGVRDRGLQLIEEADRKRAHDWLKGHLKEHEHACQDRDHHRVFKVETMLGIGQQDKKCDPLGFYGPPTAPWLNMRSEPQQIHSRYIPTITRSILTNDYSLDRELCETWLEMWQDIDSYPDPWKIEQHVKNQWIEFNCSRFFGE